MANTPKYLALISAISLSFFAAACGSDDGGTDDAVNGTDTTTTTEAGAEGADSGDDSNGDADSGDNGGSGDGSNTDLPGAEALDGMTEVDSIDFTGNGSGINAGTHFASTDGSIVCGITSAMAACHVGGNTIEWDAADRADDGNGEDMDFADMIGWNPGVDAEFGEKPKTWLLQGQFAPIAVELDDGTKLTVVTATDGNTLDITCGSKDNRVTCVSGDHGFTVGVAAYRVW